MRVRALNALSVRWHRWVDRVRRRPVVFVFVTVMGTLTVVLGVFAWALTTVSNANDSNRQAAESNRDLIDQVRVATATNRELIKKVAVLAAQGKQSHDASCAYKRDLARRINEGYEFLADPPERILGIPVTPEVIAQVKSNIANQTSTFRSYSTLECSPEAILEPAPPAT